MLRVGKYTQSFKLGETGMKLFNVVKALQPASVDHVRMKLVILFFYPVTEINKRCINIVHVYPLYPIKL